MKKEKYKFCDRHNQKYMATLKYCPICLGEKMDGYMLRGISEEELRRALGLYGGEGHDDSSTS